ncbi:hypothetical protein LCGC14_2267200 [marine sediment metagenome]|uniref:Uncharacterized protein n=1 Tax=marine sediment metagenome TaxID=412755 RepID=A0A0F9FAE5_9ZZZZ
MKPHGTDVGQASVESFLRSYQSSITGNAGATDVSAFLLQRFSSASASLSVDRRYLHPWQSLLIATPGRALRSSDNGTIPPPRCFRGHNAALIRRRPNVWRREDDPACREDGPLRPPPCTLARGSDPAPRGGAWPRRPTKPFRTSPSGRLRVEAALVGYAVDRVAVSHPVGMVTAVCVLLPVLRLGPMIPDGRLVVRIRTQVVKQEPMTLVP